VTLSAVSSHKRSLNEVIRTMFGGRNHRSEIAKTQNEAALAEDECDSTWADTESFSARELLLPILVCLPWDGPLDKAF
jgi:hypothetical protein